MATDRKVGGQVSNGKPFDATTKLRTSAAD